MARKIRVLVVDDSFIFRETIAREIAKDKAIEVVGKATDAYNARDLIIKLRPDVMTLDVEMPKMNGIEFLKKLIPQYPMPVVVVSSFDENIFDALESGAVDFVCKPQGKELDSFINELIIKIKVSSASKLKNIKKVSKTKRVISKDEKLDKDTIIAIGASTGGTQAILETLKVLPRNIPGIVITQHMPPVFTRMYAERLNSICKIDVKEAETGDIIEPGKAFVAPGDYHMKIKKDRGKYIINCFKSEKVNGHRPSVDILFNSVAENAGKKSIGIILTGMGNDGSKGLLNMKNSGAVTIGQDETSSVIYGMPKVAYDIGAVDRVVSLKEIPREIYKILTSCAEFSHPLKVGD